MKRNFNHFNVFLNKLYEDIYDQPQDDTHTALAQEIIVDWVSMLVPCENVLDVGCGEGFCQPIFEELDIEYTGVCLGEDYTEAKAQGRNVVKMDFSFLDYPDNSFDLIFSRHSVEHSAVGPLLSFMEWHRVSRNWLCVIVPDLIFWTFKGQNHYYVLPPNHYLMLLERAGWNPIWKKERRVKTSTEKDAEPHGFEHWFMCEKIR